MKKVFKILGTALIYHMSATLVLLPCINSIGPATVFASENSYESVGKNLESDIAEKEAIIADKKRSGPLDEEPPMIQHEPLSNSGKHDITIEATIEDGTEVASATLHYRVKGNVTFEKTKMRKTEGDQYVGVIPETEVSLAGMEYYIEASDLNNNIATDGNKEIVYGIAVDGTQKETTAANTTGKKPIYKKWWFWALALGAVVGGGVGLGGGGGGGGGDDGGGDGGGDGGTGTVIGTW